MGFCSFIGDEQEPEGEEPEVEEPRGRSQAKRSGKSTANKASVQKSEVKSARKSVRKTPAKQTPMKKPSPAKVEKVVSPIKSTSRKPPLKKVDSPMEIMVVLPTSEKQSSKRTPM